MIVYGKNVIKEAVLNRRPIYRLFLDEKLSDHEFKLFLETHQIKFQMTNKGELNKMTNNANHQGVVADVKEYRVFSLEEVLDENKVQKFLILDELQDPHNLGAILRSAEATNIDGVIIGRKNQVSLNATVAKVSAGAIEHVAIIEVSNVYQAILRLKQKGVLVVGTEMHAETNYRNIPKYTSVAIVMGNEGVGMRPLVKKGCDMLVSIPMCGKVNSLNVSVAAALLLYAMLD